MANQQVFASRAVNFPCDRIRSLFPALHEEPGFIFFDNGAGAQIPLGVFDAIHGHLLHRNVQRGGRYARSVEVDATIARARESVAALINARDPDEIAFGMNATSFLRLLSLAIGRTLATRNEIVVTDLDHEANIATWMQLEREGARIVWWKMREDNNLHVADLAPLLTAKTRLVACTVASHALGSIVDVAAVAKLAHGAGAEVVLDCVHYAPHALIDVQAFDCDYLVCSGYKVFGPHMGFMWGRLELLNGLPTFREDFIPDAAPGKIEAGTFIYENVAGMAAAIAYLETLGRSHGDEEENAEPSSRRGSLVRAMNSIREYEAALSFEMLEVLQAAGAIVYGIDDTARLAERVPTFCFSLPNVAPALVTEAMSERGIGIRDGHMYAPRLMKRLGASLDTGVNRASLVHYNTLHEIHEFGKVLLDMVRVDKQAAATRAPMALKLAGTPGSSPELRRALTQRQLTMMTIGGAIGVGLFLGSSVTIRLAGPGVILSYLFSAVIALIVAYSIAELAVTHPVAGSFGVYAQTYLNEWSGFAVRVTYVFVQILAIGAEVTAVAIYFSVWFPPVPQWIWVVGVSVGLITINALRVGNFGEFEYWFAIIKVITIVAFILIGLGLIFGVGPARAIGFTNLTSHGGFLPHGLTGVWLALSLTLTSYMGVEIIGVTAGEALQPEKTIPRAIRTVTLRLILFYVLSITVMLSMTPWNMMGSGITGSPFVLAFAKVGIPYAAGIMNLVVITAALSSANTNLYLTSRTLFSLSHDGYVPRALGGVGRNGVPFVALIVSTAGMAAAILLAIFAPGRAFLLLYGVAVAGMFFVWSVILLAHLSFRRSIGEAGVALLPIRLPFSPYSQVTALVALAAIAISTFYVTGLEYSVPSFVPFLLVITILYWTLMRKNRSVRSDSSERNFATPKGD